MPRILTLFAIAISVAACGTRHTPAAPPPPVRLATVDLTSASQSAPRTDALYVYSPVGKRDPFTKKGSDYWPDGADVKRFVFVCGEGCYRPRE